MTVVPGERETRDPGPIRGSKTETAEYGSPLSRGRQRTVLKKEGEKTMPNARTFTAIAALAALAFVAPSAHAQDKSIIVASTTSTQDSGLFGYLLPKFQEKTGITVKVVALGTGQALDTARRCDADVVFVHAKAQEEKFLNEGHGVKRFPVMYNDFILIGPKNDSAHVAGMKNVAEALHRIKEAEAPFISRGDRSGTHTAELKLWQDASIDIEKEHGDWYKSIGQGMGAA